MFHPKDTSARVPSTLDPGQVSRKRVKSLVSIAYLPLLIAVAISASGWAESGSSTTSAPGKTRTYYVAADQVVWDYAPGGVNQVTGKPFGDAESFWVSTGPHLIGKVVKKALYREYTDASFTQLKPRPKQWAHLGFLGPIIRAEVGDTIHVVFRNNLSFPVSMHPHGVFYERDSEGAVYHSGVGDESTQAVQPGSTHTYVWPVPERAGPADEMSSVLWMYHSHVNEIADTNAGLVGPIIVTARGMARPDGTPKDVDKEFVLAFSTVLEAESPYFEDNVQAYAGEPKTVKIVTTPNGARGVLTGVPGLPFDPVIRENINGFLFGNTPGLTMNVGDRVRWYVMATSNFELHAPHWHGNTVVIQHMRTDVAALQTMGMFTADMVPDNAGTWLLHCHVGGHLRAGMQALYTVEPKGTSKLSASMH